MSRVSLLHAGAKWDFRTDSAGEHRDWTWRAPARTDHTPGPGPARPVGAKTADGPGPRGHSPRARVCYDTIHLESYPPDKNVYVQVSIMFVQPMYNAIVHPYYVHWSYMYILFWKCMYMYIHFQKSWTCTYSVCTWYVHVYIFQGINMYVHSSDVYVHVLTFTNTLCFLQTRTYHV